MMQPLSDWNATAFFEDLLTRNRLAKSEGFVFCRVSGLEGFEEALSAMQTATALCCVSDIADGYTELNNSPRTRRVKTVFLAMRHAAEDMEARNACMETMRELFRQMMSVLILEKTKLEQNCIYLDPRISFNEVDRYFFSGCACAYFQIAVDKYTDLRYNEEEWVIPKHIDVWLTSYTYEYKVALVKLTRTYTNLGLAESKKLVDSAPVCILSGINISDYPTIISDFANIGAVIKFVEHGQHPTD